MQTNVDKTKWTTTDIHRSKTAGFPLTGCSTYYLHSQRQTGTGTLYRRASFLTRLPIDPRPTTSREARPRVVRLLNIPILGAKSTLSSSRRLPAHFSPKSSREKGRAPIFRRICRCAAIQLCKRRCNYWEDGERARAALHSKSISSSRPSAPAPALQPRANHQQRRCCHGGRRGCPRFFTSFSFSTFTFVWLCTNCMHRDVLLSNFFQGLSVPGGTLFYSQALAPFFFF